MAKIILILFALSLLGCSEDKYGKQITEKKTEQIGFVRRNIHRNSEVNVNIYYITLMPKATNFFLAGFCKYGIYGL
jgi:hypothetical protein